MTSIGAPVALSPPQREPAIAPRLGPALSTPDNALNFLRLVLALLVILSHTPAISGARGWPAWMDDLGPWAVHGFFLISGYLVAGSRLRSSWWSYSLRRLARIFPAYWVQLLFVALLAAPLATLLGPSTWSPAAAVAYIRENASTFGLQYTLEGTEFPHFDAWNGSAWTLSYELLAYLGCLAVFALPLARRHPAVVSGLVYLGATALTALGEGPLDISTNHYLELGRLASCFAAGMLLHALRGRIPVRWPLVAIAGLLCAVLYVLPSFSHLAQLPWGYALLGIASLLPVRIGAVTDLSYGVYIYAFPVQQLLAMAGVQRCGALTHLLLATLITLLLARLSWSLVELPAMNGAKALVSAVRSRRTMTSAPDSLCRLR